MKAKVRLRFLFIIFILGQLQKHTEKIKERNSRPLSPSLSLTDQLILFNMR